MKNETPTQPIAAFAASVLDVCILSGQTWEQYVAPETFAQLTALAIEAGATTDANSVSLAFNGRCIVLGKIGQQNTPGLSAFKNRHGVNGYAYRTRCSVKKAARIMLDELPQERRKSVSESELDKISGSMNCGATFAFQDRLISAFLTANKKQKRTLLVAFPKLFHGLIKGNE